MEWKIPDMPGRTGRWLERTEWFGSFVIYKEHWTTNDGCYQIETVYDELL